MALFTKGGKWQIVKDLSGFPTHESGGVDLVIGSDGVRVRNGNSEFHAADGMVIANQDPVNPILTNIYKKYPALKKLGNVTLKEDPAFTRDATGSGSIEYFSPTQDTVSYKTGLKYGHPNIGTHGIVYNPSENNEQDIALDLLHGMDADSKYKGIKKDFTSAFMRKYSGDFLGEWKEYNKETGGDNDGMDQYKNNWIDGQIRNLLFEGTKEDFEKSRYWPDAQKVYLKDEDINKSFVKLKSYLKTGK